MGANMYINLALVVWLTNQMEAEGKLFGVEGELQDFFILRCLYTLQQCFLFCNAVSQVQFNSMVTGNNFVMHVIYTMTTSSHVLF